MARVARVARDATRAKAVIVSLYGHGAHANHRRTKPDPFKVADMHAEGHWRVWVANLDTWVHEAAHGRYKVPRSPFRAPSATSRGRIASPTGRVP